MKLPTKGSVLFSVKDSDKSRAFEIASRLKDMDFEILGTPGTAEYFQSRGLAAVSIPKIGRSALGGDLLEVLQSKKAQWVVNTTGSPGSIRDGITIRQAALKFKIPLFSTLSGADMASRAIETLREVGIRPLALQDLASV
jgi:carbamoyl-phosphate synthase large subunit